MTTHHRTPTQADEHLRRSRVPVPAERRAPRTAAEMRARQAAAQQQGATR